MVVIDYPLSKKLALELSKLLIDNGQEGGKRCEELRAQEDRNKFGASLFSLSFY
jgi:hypothetical protein